MLLSRGDPDPRVPGLNYYIAARLPPENAAQAAEYLASRGVPALRVLPDDDKMCKVVVLRGFDAASLKSEEAGRLREQVLSIGRDFKIIERGGDDFASMYAEKFKAP